MERLPFDANSLPRPAKKYSVFFRGRLLGQSVAVSPEKAINNVCWSNGLYGAMTKAEYGELYAKEALCNAAT